MFCREWLAQLEHSKDQIAAAGLSVVGVAISEPKHAQRYCPQLAPSLVCLCGLGIETHKAYGLQQGNAAQLVGPQVVIAGTRAAAKGILAKGIVAGEVTGNWKMLAGTFIVNPAGLIQYSFYSDFAGDHPPLTEILNNHASK